MPHMDDESLTDAAAPGSPDYEHPLIATQSQSQSQSQSQHSFSNPELDEDLVGCLIPVTEKCQRFSLRKDKENGSWKLGRFYTNDLVLPGDSLSNYHCTLNWNGGTGTNSEVVLTDSSSHGTWVNDILVKKGQKAILRSGAEISLGRNPKVCNDWRFIFRDIEGQSTRHMNQIWTKYDIGLELGAGAFARVHKCIERVTGDEYAVKIINRSKLHRFHTSEEAVAREILILEYLAEAHHEHLVSLREFFEEEDSIYLILELVGGGDLLTYMHIHAPISEQLVRRMAAQICRAVAYIHSQGIAHRDLKPENVLLTATDPPDCKVADFGLAKLVGSGTFLKTMCGTPAYLAPEIMLRNSPLQGYDNRVDSWSLGVIFYCMLTKHSPFNESFDPKAAPADQRQYFRTRKVNWQVLRDRHVSDDGANFLRYLLAEDPRNRKDVLRMLDHPWISALIPSDPQFQHPPWPSYASSLPPAKADGTLVCSQSFVNISISDISIPGLNLHRPATADMSVDPDLDVGVDTFPSAMSVIAQIPEVLPPEPKKDKGRQPLSAVEQSTAENSLCDFVDPGFPPKARDRDMNVNEPGPSRRTPSPAKVPAKRRYNLIASSSSLSSLPDEDEDEVKESAKQAVVRHAPSPRNKGKGKAVEAPPHRPRDVRARPSNGRSKRASTAQKDDLESSEDENLHYAERSSGRHPPAKVPRYA